MLALNQSHILNRMLDYVYAEHSANDEENRGQRGTTYDFVPASIGGLIRANSRQLLKIRDEKTHGHRHVGRL